ncbi:MAG: YigZ family protein [Bacteroidales bacterium]|mgnify:CR=1 FL=1|jgi:uncharacterized YigZ family protein|nr:YigZ family protein [Bacteroidales bacterium]HOL98251.1 YigZ family protein [Bacteroidales bacterium]HOM36604.1 YigZ family protein [Bacteroidales bacterium]HPD24030.1 YigZ family protein [Bacteroidales bacterium]HRT00019.1 YigZ family protein [Bacteroidales bacterium]
MIDYYKSIKQPAQGIYTEKGSKFLSFAYPVSSEDEVKNHLVTLKKEYFDAKHHVYAFIIGAEGQIYRASDDGEPYNSSGLPILNQIKSFGISDVLIVVVRYFGGTKLGIPGLINAYKSAAYDALSKCEIIEKFVSCNLKVVSDYDNLNFVMKIIKEYNCKIIKQEFAEDCSLVFEIRLSLADEIISKLKTNHIISVLKK